jgi:hypothetical protein
MLLAPAFHKVQFIRPQSAQYAYLLSSARRTTDITPISANSSASLCLPHNSRVDSLPSRRRRMWHGSSHRPPSETLLKPASELSYCKYFPTSSFRGIDDQYINYGYVCPHCQRPSVLNFFDDRFNISNCASDSVHSKALSSLPLVFVATMSEALYRMTDARYDYSLGLSAWHQETYPH